MKKHISLSMRIVLSLLAFMMTMQMSAESCSLHFSDITINPGGTAKMVVSYETDYENLTGFEFHFALPEGICMTTSSLSNALMQVCPSLTLEYNNQRDDVTIIMCYTFLEKLPSGKHDLMVLTFQADQNVAKQVYNIETTNNQFAYKGATSPNYLENQIFHITVVNQLIPIKRGDVNGDGGTTLQDILILVDYILAGKPSVIDAQNYDIDGDGDVSLSDILIVVDIILNGGAEEQSYLTCPDDHHPHMIDLGLPSGTKWACCNVGATTPEGYGGYYAWGETEEKSDYSWETYIHCDGTQETCHDIGNDIAGTQYDVAHMKWGGNWVMPTNDQIQELFDNCTHEWKTINGIDGRLFTSQNGCVVFFPAAGDRWKEVFVGTDVSGYYWSSTRLPSSSFEAYVLGFYSILAGLIDNMRNYGMTIRPVAAPKPMDELSLSDETVDMFVNSTATVSIESGSGDYELQNDNPDVIDAELILADKNENPNAKDEISIYGVTEGAATLTVLDKKSNKTATVVVNVKTPTDEDIAETEEYIARVNTFISQQGEISVANFQNNLTSWLGEQDWVKAFNSGSVTSLPVLMTISFVNGANYLVSLIDYDDLIGLGIDEDFHSSEYYASKELPTNSSIDVSTVVGEDIIDNTNVLHIQGRTMPSFDKQNRSTAERENYLIQQSKNKSPIKFEITPQFKDPSFLEWNSLNNYGMILLGQTHGGFLLNSTYSGSFDVENGLNSLNRGVKVIVDKDKVVKIDEEHNIYYVTPIKLKNKIDDKTIFYSSYCYSYYLRQCNFNATFFGYGTREMYQKGSYQMAEFFYNMSMGLTYEKAIESMMKPYDYKYDGEKEYSHVIPATNNPNSKQRYFSISIDDFTDYSATGNPIIKGSINGYKNLKSGIKYKIYVVGKDKQLKPTDINSNGRLININEDGIFEYEYKNLPVTELPEEYQVVVGFKYEGITYYGPIRTLMTKGLCPDNHHPHLIDLGLPSGTKWACCNVGADKPEAYGNYYAWGETEANKTNFVFDTYQHIYENNYGNWDYKDIGADIAGSNFDVAHVKWGGAWVMPSINQMNELRDVVSGYWMSYNGVKGRLIIGPNGNKIFIPAAGRRKGFELLDCGGWCELWSSTLNTEEYKYAYVLCLWDYKKTSNDYRFQGLSVRPVSR